MRAHALNQNGIIRNNEKDGKVQIRKGATSVKRHQTVPFSDVRSGTCDEVDVFLTSHASGGGSVRTAGAGCACAADAPGELPLVGAD